jgi:hypothetical protein
MWHRLLLSTVYPVPVSGEAVYGTYSVQKLFAYNFRLKTGFRLHLSTTLNITTSKIALGSCNHLANQLAISWFNKLQFERFASAGLSHGRGLCFDLIDQNNDAIVMPKSTDGSQLNSPPLSVFSGNAF